MRAWSAPDPISMSLYPTCVCYFLYKTKTLSEGLCFLQILDSSAVELRVLQLSCVSRRWTVSKLDQEQGAVDL